MNEQTARFALPLIAPGQAQKELTHNESLALVDLLLQPAVVALGLNVPPPAPVAGQCWIVGDSPSGNWTGHAHALAGWTGSGWRFAPPVPEMTIWTGGPSGFARWSGTSWAVGEVIGTALHIDGEKVVGGRGAAITEPHGGITADVEARSAITLILAALREHGLIAD